MPWALIDDAGAIRAVYNQEQPGLRDIDGEKARKVARIDENDHRLVALRKEEQERKA